MRVLLVAPRQNLPAVDEEIQNVLRSGLAVTPLLGEVKLPELMREIRSGQYDVLWFATHGSVEGIQLSDEQLLTADELIPLVRDKFGLVVLNTCSSFPVAQQLQIDANVGVICTLLDVADRQAFITGSQFANHLHETSNITTAFRASIPGRNRSYVYLPQLEPPQDIIVQEIQKLRADMNETMAREVRRLQWLVWIGWSLHIPEWIVIVYLLMGRG